MVEDLVVVVGDVDPFAEQALTVRFLSKERDGKCGLRTGAPITVGIPTRSALRPPLGLAKEQSKLNIVALFHGKRRFHTSQMYLEITAISCERGKGESFH